MGDIGADLYDHTDVGSQVTFSYPIGGERVMEHLPVGISAVAGSANAAMRTVDRRLRSAMEAGDLPPEDVQRAMTPSSVPPPRGAHRHGPRRVRPVARPPGIAWSPGAGIASRGAPVAD